MQENFIQVDGYKTIYLESGDSKNLLVLVHEFGASAQIWDKVVPILNKDFRVVIPDLIGSEFNDKSVVENTPNFLSEFFGKFLDASGIERPNILGSSLGDQIAAEDTNIRVQAFA